MRTCSRNLLFLGLVPRARSYQEFSRTLMDLPGVSLAGQKQLLTLNLPFIFHFSRYQCLMIIFTNRGNVVISYGWLGNALNEMRMGNTQAAPDRYYVGNQKS